MWLFRFLQAYAHPAALQSLLLLLEEGLHLGFVLRDLGVLLFPWRLLCTLSHAIS